MKGNTLDIPLELNRKMKDFSTDPLLNFSTNPCRSLGDVVPSNRMNGQPCRSTKCSRISRVDVKFETTTALSLEDERIVINIDSSTDIFPDNEMLISKLVSSLRSPDDVPRNRFGWAHNFLSFVRRVRAFCPFILVE